MKGAGGLTAVIGVCLVLAVPVLVVTGGVCWRRRGEPGVVDGRVERAEPADGASEVRAAGVPGRLDLRRGATGDHCRPDSAGERLEPERGQLGGRRGTSQFRGRK
jgi:hypothetical protein